MFSKTTLTQKKKICSENKETLENHTKRRKKKNKKKDKKQEKRKVGVLIGAYFQKLGVFFSPIFFQLALAFSLSLLSSFLFFSLPLFFFSLLPPPFYSLTPSFFFVNLFFSKLSENFLFRMAASDDEQRFNEDDYEEKLGFRVLDKDDLVCTVETDQKATACKIALDQFYENYFRANRERNERFFFICFEF